MTRKLLRFLLMLFLIVGVTATWGCGCGDTGFRPDTTTDGEDEDTGTTDTTTDGDDTADMPTDTGDVPEDTPTDEEEDDGGGTGGGTPFTAETSGGSRLTSPNYILEVFIAPVRPVGRASSTNYEVKLGPGGIRSH